MVLDNISASIEELNSIIDADFQDLAEKMDKLLNAVNKLIELQTMASKYTMELNDNFQGILLDYNGIKTFLMSPQGQIILASIFQQFQLQQQPKQEGSVQ